MSKALVDPIIHHFSHEHPLQLSNLQQQNQNQITASCSGCKLKASGWIYTCKPCNYTLHITCSQLPQKLTHPSDPNHQLTLLPFPIYPEGAFKCNACDQIGTGFCFHCTDCDLDIHSLCAIRPLSVNHEAHHHPLNITFSPPYSEKAFNCDICNGTGSNHWLYRCNICEFDAHLSCAIAKPKSVDRNQIQQQVGQPEIRGANQPWIPLQYQGSPYVQPYQQVQVPYMAPQFPPLGIGSSNGSREMNRAAACYVHTPGSSVHQFVQPPPPGRIGSVNNVVGHLVQEFMGGLGQQVGQGMIQGLLGGNSSSSSGIDVVQGLLGGGDSSSSSGIDIGSVILNSVIGLNQKTHSLKRDREMEMEGYEPLIQHFSHQHPLELTTFQQTHITNLCSGCKLKLSGWLYTCYQCNYFLHASCSQMPQLINHPADPNHALSLFPYPAYPEGYFHCDACGRTGDGFAYHCGPCNLDIHILCASMPLSLNHQAHHHTLNLALFPPYQNKGFSCDICKRFGSNHWLYRCEACEFDAHLGCATAKTRPLAQVQIQQLQVLQQQTPQFQDGYRAGVMNGTQQSYTPNYYMNNENPGVQQPVEPLSGPNGLGNELMYQEIQGLIDGSMQQIHQSLVQNIMEGGGAADTSSSISVLDIGSSSPVGQHLMHSLSFGQRH
ncbi:uncharacterized protein LOC143886070 [Tasmannia lanceolata]|uniref:uncharacterized protein LOC143886070 n=1 Tax=Tasmannia lanceolata TaxID=3420 RepID=UPI004063C3C7